MGPKQDAYKNGDGNMQKEKLKIKIEQTWMFCHENFHLKEQQAHLYVNFNVKDHT